MCELEPYNLLINELTSFGVSKKRMLEIRDELLQIVFDFKDASVFDTLVRWDYHLKKRIEANKSNLECPGNAVEVNAISETIRLLSWKNN